MATFSLYRQTQAKAWNKEIDWNSDTIVMTQHTASYVPNLDTHAYVSDLTNEVATGAGYTQGGVLLASRAAAYVPANAWQEQWGPLVPYQVGQIVRPTTGNGLLFRCITAGTSGVSQPSWPTLIGGTVVDSGATWQAIAAGAIQLTAASIQWLSYLGSLRYLVISDRSPGSASQQPLIGLCDLGTTSTGSGGNFDVTFDTAGVFALWAS